MAKIHIEDNSKNNINIGYIYKITNQINKKIYIGQTSRTVKLRWQEHINSSRYSYRNDYDNKLHRAMRKYGLNNFTIEEIEKCSINKLHEREKFWIAYYHSTEVGYNISVGGEGNRKVVPEKVLELWKMGKNCKEICEICNTSYTTLSEILNSFNITPQQRIDRGFDIKVGIDKNLILDEFNKGLSINKIVKKYQVSDKWVQRVLAEFQVTKEQIFSNAQKGHSTSGSPCAIEQYTLQKEKVAKYSSIKEAKLALGKSLTNTSLNKRLKHDSNYHYYDGYYWRYVE